MAHSESQARLTQTEPAKWIVVYKNGDQHFAGRRMVVKPREIRTFDHLLEEVTVKLSPSFGAVRNIFTPEGGTRVASLTELKPNGKYVASPNEPFRQLSRTRYGEIPVQSTSISHSRVSLRPARDKQVGATGGGRRLHAVPSRYRESGTDEITIHVYRNGDAFTAASPLRVDRVARSHWQQTLSRLGEKLRIGRGVHKLYSLKGHLVRDPATDLEHNGLYVAAADNESFRLVNYGATREPFRSVTRGDSRTGPPHLPCPHQRIPDSAPSAGVISGSSDPRLAAPQSVSAPLPPLRTSYPQLARRCAQLREKCALRAQKAREQQEEQAPSDRKSRSLHFSLSQPVPPVQPRPPLRSTAIAPIDVAPVAAASVGAFSPDSDGEEDALMRVLSPTQSRPEPFYLHPVLESGDDGPGRRGGGGRWGGVRERRLGSPLMSGVERWSGESCRDERDGCVVMDRCAVSPTSEMASSHSAPHLSQPPSRTDSGEGTPPPPHPLPSLPHPHRPPSGFLSAGYSPPPHPATPRTPPLPPVTLSPRPPGHLAAGGGSRPASRAASEPRLNSRLSRETPEPAPCEMTRGSCRVRCVSVRSAESGEMEAVSAGTPEVGRPGAVRARSVSAPAPASCGESPARVTPEGGVPEPGGSARPAVEAQDGSLSSAESNHSSVTLVGASSSEEERLSPAVMTEEHDLPLSSSEDRRHAYSRENAAEGTESPSTPASDHSSSDLPPSLPPSPLTPELRRPLLAGPAAPRDLLLPPAPPAPVLPPEAAVAGRVSGRAGRSPTSPPAVVGEESAPSERTAQSVRSGGERRVSPVQSESRGVEVAPRAGVDVSEVPSAADGEPGNQSVPPPDPLEERLGPPVPSARHRPSVAEHSPLSWSGTAAATGGWLWDEIPARPADRARVAPPVAPPLVPVPPTVALPVAVAPSEPERPPPQPVWPPTRTNTPQPGASPESEQSNGPAAEPGLAPEASSNPPETPPLAPAEETTTNVTGAGVAHGVAESAVADRVTEPAVADRGTELAPVDRVTELAVLDRGTELAPADIGRKLDEIAALLRTLLLQNMTAGGGGAAPALAGLSEEQLRALLGPVASRAADGDSPPHKPR